MHEETLLRDLKRKVEEVALSNDATHIRRISIWVGALAHISDDQLRRRWTDLVVGGVAEGAHLLISRSMDPDDPKAQSIVLTSVDVDLRDPAISEGGERVPRA